MFRHDSIPCFFLGEKLHNRINTRKEMMGQKKRGGRTGHRLHKYRICDAATEKKMASLCR